MAFELSINGNRRYLAGHSDALRLVLLLSGDCHARDAHISTSIVVPHDGPAGSATLSYETETVLPGDEITIRLVDVKAADAPTKRNDGNGSYRIAIAESE